MIAALRERAASTRSLAASNAAFDGTGASTMAVAAPGKFTKARGKVLQIDDLKTFGSVSEQQCGYLWSAAHRAALIGRHQRRPAAV